jgi:CubicO group peptidase (beta-lactamase class C family)
MSRSRGLAALAVAVALAGSGCARLRPTSPAELCRLTAHEVQRGKTPSLVLAVVDADELLFLDARGTADPVAARPARPDSVYMWFSISKLFCATAIMQLVDRGLIDIDRPIADYVPDLALENPFDTPLTARHLLDHSSGLPNPPPWAWARLHDRPRPPLAALVNDVLREHGRLESEPGTRDQYSNLGYLVLGLLVERVSGTSYEDYVRANLFAPLEMHDTDFAYSDAMLQRAAIGQVRAHGLYHRWFVAAASPELFGPVVDGQATARPYLVDGAPYGGVIGTAGDLAHFAAMHLAHGIWRGRRILSARAVAAMQEIQRLPSGRPLSHALGWHTGTTQGVRYFNHMGKGGGFRPALHLYPSLGQAVIVLTNTTRYDPRPLLRRVPVRAERPAGCGGAAAAAEPSSQVGPT